MLYSLLLWIVLITAVAAWLWLQQHAERHARRHRLAKRPAVSPDDVYQQDYAPLGMTPAEFHDAWQTIAALLHVDPSRLRPEDELSTLKVRRPLHLYDDVSVLLEHVVTWEKRHVLEHVRTIDDLVRIRCGYPTIVGTEGTAQQLRAFPVVIRATVAGRANDQQNDAARAYASADEPAADLSPVPGELRR